MLAEFLSLDDDWNTPRVTRKKKEKKKKVTFKIFSKSGVFGSAHVKRKKRIEKGKKEPQIRVRRTFPDVMLAYDIVRGMTCFNNLSYYIHHHVVQSDELGLSIEAIAGGLNCPMVRITGIGGVSIFFTGCNLVCPSSLFLNINVLVENFPCSYYHVVQGITKVACFGSLGDGEFVKQIRNILVESFFQPNLATHKEETTEGSRSHVNCK
jgi:hypothetical protein